MSRCREPLRLNCDPDHRHAVLKAIPKVDLHCHLIGAIRQQTVVELAERHTVPLPRPAEALYEFDSFANFIDSLRLAATVLRTRDDFARVAFEVLEDGRRSGNLRHAELMFNPQYHYESGIAYRDMVDGLCDGLSRARSELGVSGLLIAAIDRQIDSAAAAQIMDDILSYRRDEVVGIGLDGPEGAGPPALFADIYRRAAAASLKKTAHLCEDNQILSDAPPEHYRICRDVLGCDRLDHGYNMLMDDTVMAEAVQDGLYFNLCTVTSAVRNRDRRKQSIGRMHAAGLLTTINTDDPAMFKTDIGAAYTEIFETLDWDVSLARHFSLAGIDACWLDEGSKRALRADFIVELDHLGV